MEPNGVSLLELPTLKACLFGAIASGLLVAQSRPGHRMAVLGMYGALCARALALSSPTLLRTSGVSSARSFSVLNRPSPKYPGHVPLTVVEHGALAVGSAVGALLDPRRAGKSDNRFTFHSTTANMFFFFFLKYRRSDCNCRRNYFNALFYQPTS